MKHFDGIGVEMCEDFRRLVDNFIKHFENKKSKKKNKLSNKESSSENEVKKEDKKLLQRLSEAEDVLNRMKNVECIAKKCKPPLSCSCPACFYQKKYNIIIKKGKRI